MARSIVLHNDPFVKVINRYFNNDFFRPVAREWQAIRGVGSRLPVDIYTDNDGYTFVALVPGLNADDLNVEAHGNVVKIGGETFAPAQTSEENVTSLRSEIGFGKFSRSFELPEEIDADKIEARLEKGTLTVSVPKAESVKPRSIKVKTK